MFQFISNLEVDGTIEIENTIYHSNILITPWTLIHFLSGYLSYIYGLNYLQGFIIHSIYEFVNLTNESIKKKWNSIYTGFRKDSIVNTIGDTIFFMLGMYLAKKYFNKYILYLFIIIGTIFLSSFIQNIISKMRYKFINSIFKNIKNKQIKKKYKVNFLLISWLIFSIITLYKSNLSKN